MGIREPESSDPDAPPLPRSASYRSAARVQQAVLEAVLRVPVGALLGYGIDWKFETGPWGLFIGMAFGFIALVIDIRNLPKPQFDEFDDEASETGTSAPLAPPATKASDVHWTERSKKDSTP